MARTVPPSCCMRLALSWTFSASDATVSEPTPISRVCSPCERTAPRTAVNTSSRPPRAVSKSFTSARLTVARARIRLTDSTISSVARWVCCDSVLTSPATTRKPAPASPARARLDGGVQREQVGARGDRGDHLHDALDVIDGRGEVFHAGEGRPRAGLGAVHRDNRRRQFLLDDVALALQLAHGSDELVGARPHHHRRGFKVAGKRGQVVDESDRVAENVAERRVGFRGGSDAGEEIGFDRAARRRRVTHGRDHKRQWRGNRNSRRGAR